VAKWAATFDALSPLKTLGRGYAIVTRQGDEHLIQSAETVKIGDRITVKLRAGKLGCLVEAVHGFI